MFAKRPHGEILIPGVLTVLGATVCILPIVCKP
jgi:hypothetical protein